MGKRQGAGPYLAFFGALLLFSASALPAWNPPDKTGPATIRYNLHIRPILAENCFACHGPDSAQRKAHLRLDERDIAVQKLPSGRIAVVPGHPEQSTLVTRIRSQDPEERMPPPETQHALRARDLELLEGWIRQGANYEPHWAFIPPQRPEPPRVRKSKWIRNPIDAFVLARLELEGLSPSPEADRAALLRRLSFDLTGLPPTLAELDAFLSDPRPDAYERCVERLLDSPHYGERMAVDWMDAARYADSNGYQVDRDRELFAWRDWVIRAFNTNKRFDVFTVEQLAGDLLPGATMDQRIATGFHRNHMVNEEGGIIPEEFLAEYCADRVETTATVWLGQTFNCARCHDHKFDPFTQRDFYSLYAFFHNIAEKGVGEYGASIRRNNPPMIQLPSPELQARREQLRKQRTEAEAVLDSARKALVADALAWEERVRRPSIRWNSPALIHSAGSVASGSIQVTSSVPHRVAWEFTIPPGQLTAFQLCWTNFGGGVRLGQVRLSLVEETASHTNRTIPLPVRLAESPESLPLSEIPAILDGRQSLSQLRPLPWGSNLWTRIVLERESLDPLPLTGGVHRLRVEWNQKWDEEQKVSSLGFGLQWTGHPADEMVSHALRTILSKPVAQRTGEEQRRVTDFRESRHGPVQKGKSEAARLAREMDEVDLRIPTTLVMEELKEPRATHVLMRGAYDRLGERVFPATPVALHVMEDSWPRNRLGLAKWLMDPGNPLTARVTVNRFWQSVFGTGLVRTAEDFGTKGEQPTHPELLDWLATEFIRTGWDVKGMMRLLVTSATYRQSSQFHSVSAQKDPQNRLWSRGPRFRLQAEFVRDQALAASGLLVRDVGGPSVRPYHPPGLYEQVVAGSSASTYVVGEGRELYRRSLYTYWKRSVPNPGMLTWDMPFRETCTVRRTRTNTPLQALNLMNDPTYVEAARMLAQRSLSEAGHDPEAVLKHAFRLATSRWPKPSELAVLEKAYQRSKTVFTAHPDRALALLQTGQRVRDLQWSITELAALTAVSSTLLNLDEVITKE